MAPTNMCAYISNNMFVEDKTEAKNIVGSGNLACDMINIRMFNAS